MNIIRHRVADLISIPYESVFVACTHTHLGPPVTKRTFEIDPVYNEYLFDRVASAVALAIADLKDATLDIGPSEAKGISFVRRYCMKDGTIRTNPGADSNVLGPVGESDDTVQVIRFNRGDEADIVAVNFQVHPDVIGGTKLCADYPYFVRETLEAELAAEKNSKGVHAVYFNGAQGDTNHIDLMHPDHRGLSHSRYTGRTIADAVLAVYARLTPAACDRVFYAQNVLNVHTAKGTPEQVKRAKELLAKRRNDPAAFRVRYSNQDSFGLLGECSRLVRLENKPYYVDLYVTCVGVGDVAFVGLPGEPFTAVGTGIREGSPFTMTLPCCCANGYEGYFPTRDAVLAGSYEGRSCMYDAGIAEALTEAGISVVKQVRA